MINARISNTVANVRVEGVTPHIRAKNFQTGVLTPAVTNTITAGMPIGLLLALTYANDFVTSVTPAVFRGDERPNVRIRTT